MELSSKVVTARSMPTVLHRQNVLWCLEMDKELSKRAQRFIEALPNMFPRALEARKGGLEAFHPTVKLYILSHGHARMPLFTSASLSWTADQVAAQLKADGLSLEQRDIELLVCHAGESVNSREGAAKLMELRDQYRRAKETGKEGKVKKLVAKYENLSAQQPQPTFFEHDPERLLLPLAAQLSAALKRRGFTHFRIISYKCPVAQYNPDGHVYLDLASKGGQWGVSADDHPEYRVIWH